MPWLEGVSGTSDRMVEGNNVVGLREGQGGRGGRSRISAGRRPGMELVGSALSGELRRLRNHTVVEGGG